MKNKPVVFSKHIHSTCATWSSGDAMFYHQINLNDIDFSLTEREIIKSNINHLNGEKIEQIMENEFLIQVYIESDKYFYNLVLNRRGFCSTLNKNEWENHLNQFKNKGWKFTDNYLVSTIRNQEEYFRNQLRRFEGYVIPEWSENLSIEDYRGALSKEVFENAGLQNYLKNGGCHGYIGSSDRKYEFDRELERVAKDRGFTPAQIAWFVMHSNGRHYADRLSSKEHVEKYFDEYFVCETITNK